MKCVKRIRLVAGHRYIGGYLLLIYCAKPPFPAPPLTQGGGSGLTYHVFRGAMTGRYLASWGGEAEETGHSERGEGGRGGKERNKRREEKSLSGGGCASWAALRLNAPLGSTQAECQLNSPWHSA